MKIINLFLFFLIILAALADVQSRPANNSNHYGSVNRELSAGVAQSLLESQRNRLVDAGSTPAARSNISSATSAEGETGSPTGAPPAKGGSCENDGGKGCISRFCPRHALRRGNERDNMNNHSQKVKAPASSVSARQGITAGVVGACSQKVNNRSQKVNVAISNPTIDGKGQKLKYLGTFKVTAYCPCELCCPGTADNRTAINRDARLEGIAVDKSIIPLKSWIYIEGIGWRYADDVGGAIKGNKIDLRLNSHKEALRWGVKELKVWKEK